MLKMPSPHVKIFSTVVGEFWPEMGVEMAWLSGGKAPCHKNDVKFASSDFLQIIFDVEENGGNCSKVLVQKFPRAILGPPSGAKFTQVPPHPKKSQGGGGVHANFGQVKTQK